MTNADVINYWGIVAPAGTPPRHRREAQRRSERVLAQPDVKERLDREGAEIVAGPPERLGTIIEADLAGWKKLIADVRLELQ